MYCLFSSDDGNALRAMRKFLGHSLQIALSKFDAKQYATKAPLEPMQLLLPHTNDVYLEQCSGV